jgi:S1-C subfamily serine protease
MKKLARLFCVLIVILTACLPANAPGTTSGYTIQHALHSTVSIQQFDAYQLTWRTIGSGTVVRRHSSLYQGSESKYVVLTAEHVVAGESTDIYRACSDLDEDACMPFLSGYTGGGTHSGTLGGDWAVVPVYSLPKGVRPIRVRTTPLVTGEDLFFIGHPWGDFLVAEGLASGHRIEGTTRIEKASGFVAPGSSGGAMLDRRGRLVGIIVAMPIARGPRGYPQFQHDIVLAVSVRSVQW